MSVTPDKSLLPVPIEVDGQGLSFSREWNGEGVEIEIEYPAGTWANWNATETVCRTISREDWLAIIAHVGTGA